jgi:signal peptidase II
MRTSLNRTVLLALVVTTCMGCDQVSKAAARRLLESSPPISFFGGLFKLEYVENSGAFLGMGAALPAPWRTAVMIAGPALLLAVLAIILIGRKLDTSRFVALALMLAGGAGNLIDRVFNRNEVVDFMNVGIGRLHTGIFNVADVALMLGVALLVFSLNSVANPIPDPLPERKEEQQKRPK